jgi:hypothetical protein
MKKLQLVSMASILVGLSLQAQAAGREAPKFEYQCQQDPELVGAGTELTVAPAVSGPDFDATWTRTVITMPPRTYTQTFENLTRDSSANFISYRGAGFVLSVSAVSQTNVRIGTYYPATLTLTDTNGLSETQNLFCKPGQGIGLPAVTGSN